jgi:hypothetical protein
LRDASEKQGLMERQRQVELAKRHNRAHIGAQAARKPAK